MVVSFRPRRPQLHRSVRPPPWYPEFGLYGPSCTATFGVGRPHGPCDPSCTSAFGPTTGCQPSALTDPMAVMPSAGYKRLAYTSRALHSSIPLWLSVIGLYSPSSTATIGSGRPHGTCSLHCMSSIGLYSLSSTATIGSGQPHGTCSLHCMSSIGLYSPSSTAAFGFGRRHSPRRPAARQPSATISLAVLLRSASADIV